jgi:hypothetical protein
MDKCSKSPHMKLELSKNVVDQEKLALIKVWYVRRIYRMHIKYGNRWMEYGDSIRLMDRPSTMEISLSWYKKGTNNKWTYDFTYHLMIDLETIIAIASMTYVIDLDAFELHLGDEKLFIDFINEC